ncbi:MAG: YidC/Oxa1 family membrane protein insertase [Patescibacteria group bacterium]
MFYFVYHEFLYRPLFNALVFLVDIMPGHDMGLAVIALTILVRVALFPLTHKSVRAQVKMKELEPHIAVLRDKYKDNKEEQAKRTMELYKEHGVNPMSGCLVALIQLPILIALYYLFWRGLDFSANDLYSFVARPEIINMNFFGLLDLQKPSLVFALLAGISQFLQMRLAQPPLPPNKGEAKSFQADFSRAMRLQTTYVLPAFIAFISMRFPAVVALYWTTTNIFAIVHESAVRRRANILKSQHEPNKSTITTHPRDQRNNSAAHQ